jgi:hypothetical protein
MKTFFLFWVIGFVATCLVLLADGFRWDFSAMFIGALVSALMAAIAVMLLEYM